MNRTALKAQKHFDDKVIIAQAQIAKFVDTLKSDPDYAMTWADKQFQAAANASIYGRLSTILLDEMGRVGNAAADALLEPILRDAERAVLRHAINTSQSTSPSSNQMDRARAAAYGEVVEYLSR